METARPGLEETIHLTIQRLGINGEGIGYLDGYTVFVDGALPGEEIEARLVERKKSYGKGQLLRIRKPSPDRVEPPCPLFGRCGGCQIMHLRQDAQLEMKRQRVADALERIGKLGGITVLPCRPSPSPLHYRNKIQLPVRPGPSGLQLGFYARGSHDLIPVERCYIHCALGETVYQAVRKVLLPAPVPAYEPQTGSGELRFVLIKSALATREALVVLVAKSADLATWQPLAAAMREACPAIKGVVLNVNPQPGNVVLGKKFITLSGSAEIEENLMGLRFNISAASFFQVNPAQAEQVYSQVIAFAGLSGKETVLDAYCGVGTMALAAAAHCRQVIGVECVPEAIVDARKNAERNGIANAAFHCADAAQWIQTLEAVDVVLLNPPRKGCEPALLQRLGKLAPATIVYVSCDPATLARDLALLATLGFAVECVQPFDMFPQTAHLETVVKLRRT